MQLILKFLLALLGTALLAMAGAWWCVSASLPEDNGPVSLPGLGNPVQVYYDSWHRPYVEATDLADAFAAQGWLHASHRLWQMELFRRAGSGRMAEMLGQDLVETDRQLWRFGVPQLGQRLAANASAEMTRLVEAYIRGVNAAIEGYRVLPPEFLLLRHRVRPWTTADVFALGALMAFQSSNNADREILRAALRERVGEEPFALFMEDGSDRPDFPFVLQSAGGNGDHAPGITREENWLSALGNFDHTDPAHQPLMPRLAFGSNGWVVGPSRSATGKALFAFDSHDALGLPNLFYEVHLFFGESPQLPFVESPQLPFVKSPQLPFVESPQLPFVESPQLPFVKSPQPPPVENPQPGVKTRQIRGWSVPGLPGVINGYNEAIAWGFTNIGDSQDLFLETPVPGRPGYFQDGDEVYAARPESVTIPVRDAEPVTLEILHTRNGPLISESPPLALRWTVQDVGDLGLDGLLAFNLARNWEEFNAALDLHAAPVLNATYADRDGNIGFRTAGLLPQRAAGEGLLPLPAHPDHAWQGLVPAADMPRLSNPPEGFIAAANARVHPAGSYPLVSADNAAPYRIARLQSVLGGEDLLTVADMRALQRDWYDEQAALLLPAMLDAMVRDDRAEEERLRLEHWLQHPVASADSGAALLFQAWYLDLADTVFRDRLGDSLYRRLLGKNYLVNAALDTLLLTDKHQGWWPRPRGEVLAASLARSASALKSELGQPGEWRLDRKQSVGLAHELSKAVPQLAPLFAVDPKPWGGSPAAVGRANYRYQQPFEVVHGATVRTVGALSNPPEFHSVIPGGQSGHPLSPHYSDQFTPWREGELLEVESRPRAEYTFQLKP